MVLRAALCKPAERAVETRKKIDLGNTYDRVSGPYSNYKP